MSNNENQLPETAAPGAEAPNEGEEVAVLNTTHGRIVLKFFPEKAPKHVENFANLSKEGFYDGTRFHRVIPGFMIQGGDPETKDDSRKQFWGTGGPDHSVEAEFNDIHHSRGILSMARTADPNSAGSQFFLMHQDSPHLNGQYSAFGQVIEGMDVIDKIADLDRDERDCPLPKEEAKIEKVEMKQWPNL
jgi:cyclophilin family peptidyl-prolyl cis-trans isomerase